jgi:PAS domain S-box-containing protein
LERNGQSNQDQPRFLALLLDAVEQAVIATDRAGRILHWNRFAERLYGWHADEVIERNIVDVLLPEAVRDRGRAAISGLPRRERTAANWTLRRRDGTSIPVRVMSTPILDDAGNAVGIVGVSWDVSEKNRLIEELQQTESRLRLFADQLPALAWATDMDLRVVWNQGAAFRQLGTDPSSLLGKTIMELVSPHSVGHPEAVDAHRRALLGETVVFEGGERGVVLQCVVQPFLDPEASIAGVVGVALDITDRKRVEGELHEKRAQLQMLSRRLLEAHEAERLALARELHDDFGQLLTAIRLNMEAAGRGTSGDRAQHLAEGIALVDQATEQIRRLAIDLRPAILDDLGLVAAVRSLLKRQSERSGFEGRLVALRLEGRLPTVVETCSFRLIQEALTNVVRHAAARSVEVELDALDRELHIVVRDDGKGFDVAAARRRAAGGASLGLLSMQERVTLAGGRLSVSSTTGQGTTIDAYVPLAEGGDS